MFSTDITAPNIIKDINKEGIYKAYPASVALNKGTLVSLNSSGQLVPISADTVRPFGIVTAGTSTVGALATVLILNAQVLGEFVASNAQITVGAQVAVDSYANGETVVKTAATGDFVVGIAVETIAASTRGRVVILAAPYSI